MTQLIIIGYGGHAKVIEDCVNSNGEFIVIGYIDIDDHEIHLKYLGTDENLVHIMKSYPNAKYVIGIGDVHLREKIIQYYEEHGVEFAKIIHASAVISESATVGDGTVVFPRAVINSDCRIMDHCIINTGSIIEHDNYLGRNVHLAPGSVTGGNVRIEDNSFIGLGSSIKNNIVIGQNCTIGCGSVVIQNLPNNSLAYGVPAKQRRP